TYAVLRAQEKLQSPPGTLFFLWLLLHAVSRVAVEFFVESPTVLGTMFTLGQVVNAGAAIVALVGLLLVSRVRAPEPPVHAATPSEMPPAV
ncbi:MAG: hypothetical protein ACRDF6_11620, partial [bacterium]